MVERGAMSMAVSRSRIWNSSRSSPAMAMLREVRLCLQALRATTDLLASERGPVESWELRRFASILELEDIELLLWVTSNKKGGPCEGHLWAWSRSEEHTSELQSQSNLVCRLLL